MNRQRKEELLKNYNSLSKNDPKLFIVNANKNGDIACLKKYFFKDKVLDIFEISENEKWNWLHRSLLHMPAQDIWTGTPLKIIQFYVEHKVPINAQDIYGMTPLHYAMRGKNVECAKVLLEAGADTNIENEKHLTPLNYINGMPEELDLLELMLKKGANPNHSNGQHGILEGIKQYRGDEPEFIPVIEMMEKYV